MSPSQYSGLPVLGVPPPTISATSPNLRCSQALGFVLYAHSWEQRKLGEVATFSKGFGFSKDDFRQDGIQLFHYGRLYTDYQCVVRTVDTYADQIENAVLSEGGEVVTPSSGETAEDIAIASAILSPGIMLGGGLNVIKPERQLDPVFLALSISGGSQHRDLAKRAQGKSIVHLYNDDLADSRLHVPPDIEEQCSIGHLFNSLDDLITLRQREQKSMRGTESISFGAPHEHLVSPPARYPLTSVLRVSLILASSSAISFLSCSSMLRTSSRSISSSSSNVSTYRGILRL